MEAIYDLGALSPKIYQMPPRICFLLHLRDNFGNEVRVVTSCPNAITSLLAARDTRSAEIHMLLPIADRDDAPALQRITEVHLCNDGKCVFRVETGEQFLSVDGQEPIAMMCLCRDSEPHKHRAA
ncbi:hypothetical protein [Paraburkholderia guartelaensis]|uniref:hypothetical protein n=1 Tax=Paraburkholderia guartelaensis TaxID=2546446 RepID=UPI002AB7161D|nr:hypothetical protein [Paraburkholderia guartelaensis]